MPLRFFKNLFSSAGTSKPPQVTPSPSDQGLTIEYCTPITTKCECCDSSTTTLNRLVERHELPYAMCRITFSDVHLEDPARGIIGIGEFGGDTTPAQRIAFGILLRPDGVMLVDATEADWPDTGILGPKLSRDAALQHPQKSELFRLIDKLYAEDHLLRTHFAKMNAR